MPSLKGAGVSGNVIRQPFVSVEIITKVKESGKTVLNAPIVTPPPPDPPGAWDLTNASYDNKSLTVSGQETGTIGLSLSVDGLKAYTTGFNTDDVFEYDLSTAFDISTGVYNGNSLNSSPQDGAMVDLYFRLDGLKLFTLGDATNAVYSYTLSTAWDISTATYDNKLIGIGTQDGLPNGLFFKDDGTKLYMVGQATDSVYQYTLSTPWDLDTATYDSVSFSITSQSPLPGSIFFKSDGTRMFIGDVTNGVGNIIQYDLSTAWDISTSVYNSVLFNTSAQGNVGVAGMVWKFDGSKVYKVSNGNNVIYQYSVSI